ncbi:lysis system i-spanin subunit Rz [Pseudomonas putida]|uniref:lysis system i-spanin subunit Rz n=1 Tax=Pseudomonas putida TaxID=303 RepID=UPI00215E3999|nr:lysis system i-spanin subunit Rz [Pseudomonas putida]UVL81294.1 lysis system i-spanin subunit Rz [Pseudomonas putida]
MFVCMAVGWRAAWVWQANAFGKELASQAKNYERQLAEKVQANSREREETEAAVLRQVMEQKNQRQALEVRLQDQGRIHWQEMNDARKTQARLRDRLATADLRLSVLVDAGCPADQIGSGGMREAADTGGLVHDPVRAQLDRAHAQRIVAITDDGDRGLIALQACQAYVREISR